VLLSSEVVANIALVLGLALILPLFDKKNKIPRTAAIGLAVYLNVRYLSWRFCDTLPPLALSWETVWPLCVFSAEAFAVLLGRSRFPGAQAAYETQGAQR
jgi:cellulose synthase (UDP-forming)